MDPQPIILRSGTKPDGTEKSKVDIYWEDKEIYIPVEKLKKDRGINKWNIAGSWVDSKIFSTEYCTEGKGMYQRCEYIKLCLWGIPLEYGNFLINQLVHISIAILMYCLH